MIPDIDAIIEMLLQAHAAADPVSEIGKAKRFLRAHLELAEQRGDRNDLRDHFAAQAVTGLLCNPHFSLAGLPSEAAKRAYQTADAMLEARNA